MLREECLPKGLFNFHKLLQGLHYWQTQNQWDILYTRESVIVASRTTYKKLILIPRLPPTLPNHGIPFWIFDKMEPDGWNFYVRLFTLKTKFQIKTNLLSMEIYHSDHKMMQTLSPPNLSQGWINTGYFTEYCLQFSYCKKISREHLRGRNSLSRRNLCFCICFWKCNIHSFIKPLY